MFASQTRQYHSQLCVLIYGDLPPATLHSLPVSVTDHHYKFKCTHGVTLTDALAHRGSSVVQYVCQWMLQRYHSARARWKGPFVYASCRCGTATHGEGSRPSLWRGLQVDQRGMRASVCDKTSWCKIHTSATGRLCWEGQAKGQPWSRISDTGGLHTGAELHTSHTETSTHTYTHTQARACICVSFCNFNVPQFFFSSAVSCVFAVSDTLPKLHTWNMCVRRQIWAEHALLCVCTVTEWLMVQCWSNTSVSTVWHHCLVNNQLRN